MDSILSLAVCAAGICGAQLAYWLPLKKRDRFRLRALLDLILVIPLSRLMVFGNSGHLDTLLLLVIYAVYFAYACGIHTSVHPAGLGSQRLLQRLDRVDLGVGV